MMTENWFDIRVAIETALVLQIADTWKLRSSKNMRELLRKEVLALRWIRRKA
jgi:hypothetical protein